MAQRWFVGFGFGPIQSGLFLLEAFNSGRFGAFTIAEVDGALVEQVRANDGAYTLNIAHRDHVQSVTVRGVEMLNPRVAADRQRLVEAIASADEMATALPSVRFYDLDASSVVPLLGEALGRGGKKSQVLYAAENDNRAAEILTEKLAARVEGNARRRFQAVNTVIGKMSGVVDDPATAARLGLAPIAPGSNRCILVEQFNRILISRITLADFERGIVAFQEKADLLPFEEAKLHGHNAIHAWIGYLAHERGLQTMDQVNAHPDLRALARRAFLEECGAALVRKYGAMQDPLFTPKGFEAYADDLLDRMSNAYLNDRVDRVIRDPARKLGWDDRLYGTMRLALSQGIEPRLMARGAAAAVRHHLGKEPADRAALEQALRGLWPAEAEESIVRQLVDLTWDAMRERS